MIFETHAHYDDKAFDKDRDALLKSMPFKGVETIVNVGASFQGVLDTVKLDRAVSFRLWRCGNPSGRGGRPERRENKNSAQIL